MTAVGLGRYRTCLIECLIDSAAWCFEVGCNALHDIVHHLLGVTVFSAQMVDSDLINEAVLVTTAVDKMARIWGLVGNYQGSLLHGPPMVRCCGGTLSVTSVSVLCACQLHHWGAEHVV